MLPSFDTHSERLILFKYERSLELLERETLLRIWNAQTSNPNITWLPLFHPIHHKPTAEDAAEAAEAARNDIEELLELDFSINGKQARSILGDLMGLLRDSVDSVAPVLRKYLIDTIPPNMNEQVKNSLINVLTSAYPDTATQDIMLTLINNENIGDTYMTLQSLANMDKWPLRNDLVEAIITIALTPTVDSDDPLSVVTYQAVSTLGHLGLILSQTGDWTPYIDSNSGFIVDPIAESNEIFNVLERIIQSRSAETDTPLLISAMYVKYEI